MSQKKQFSSQDMPLTVPIFYILLSLATKERHGYDIMRQVKLDSNDKVKLGAGTLYGALSRMLDNKLIVELKTSHARRKYYQLTDKGRSILTNELQRYNEAVQLAKQKKLLTWPPVSKLALAYV